MQIPRRLFLQAAALALPLRARQGGLRIGVTDWNLRKTGSLDAVALARQLGFDGVEVSLGRKPVGGKLPLDDAGLQEKYIAEAKQRQIALAGTCLDILHVNYLKNDRLALQWVSDGIRITRILQARVMLLPFFGKGALENRQDMEYVASALKELATEAAKAGVLLGLENTISAKDNVFIMERAGSPALKVYYDVGNSTNAGFDPIAEIPWLGRDRICQFHLKDNPHYLGEGRIDFNAVMRQIKALGFEGFANLETSSPSDSVERDMNRNLRYIRNLAV
jgi:sugar phosphate isomerase/epimerase